MPITYFATSIPETPPSPDDDIDISVDVEVTETHAASLRLIDEDGDLCTIERRDLPALAAAIFEAMDPVTRGEEIAALRCDSLELVRGQWNELAEELNQARKEIAALREHGPGERGRTCEALREAGYIPIQIDQAVARVLEDLANASERLEAAAAEIAAKDAEITSLQVNLNITDLACAGLRRRLEEAKRRIADLERVDEARREDLKKALAEASRMQPVYAAVAKARGHHLNNLSNYVPYEGGKIDPDFDSPRLVFGEDASGAVPAFLHRQDLVIFEAFDTAEAAK